MLQYFSMYESSIPKRKATNSKPRKDMEGSPPKYYRLEPGDVFAGSPSPFADTTGHETPDNQGISNLGIAAADRQGLVSEARTGANSTTSHLQPKNSYSCSSCSARSSRSSCFHCASRDLCSSCSFTAALKSNLSRIRLGCRGPYSAPKIRSQSTASNSYCNYNK